MTVYLIRLHTALGEQLRTLSKTRLLQRRGILRQETISQLNQALLIALDLFEIDQ